MNDAFDQRAAAADLERIAADEWDAVVIGAGPAGAMVAIQLARGGASVLLVEKSKFPRSKVCGCCLNMSALGTLSYAGLDDLPKRLAARPLNRVEIHIRSSVATLRLPGGAALSREAFDAALVDEAVGAGATFLPRTRAIVESQTEGHRTVRLKSDGDELLVRAKVVLVADGLAGTSLSRLPEFETTVRPQSHFGAGVILDDAAGYDRDGAIVMAAGAGGYVGAVVLEDGRLDLAAALDRRQTRGGLKVGQLAARILEKSRLPLPAGIEDAPWRGTPPLTRKRRRLTGDRLFVFGDAAGYVEPFTGEGMAWGLASAIALAPLALEAISGYVPEFARRWETLYRTVIGRRQGVCRTVSAVLRTRWLARVAVSLLAAMPWLAAPWIRSVNTPPTVANR